VIFPRRALCLSLLPGALVLGLLGAAPSPARADDTAPASGTDRAKAVQLWETGGPEVKKAAEAALVGGDDAVSKLLAQAADLQYQDDEIAAARIAGTGGWALGQAVRKALDGTPDDVKAFLKDGWQAPLQQDQRVEASRIINSGGFGVREAGKAALKGTPEDVAKFLDEGQYTARAMDNQVEVSKLINSGGPAMKTAGKLALQGTPDDVAEFLKSGQFTARAHDQERATIAGLDAHAVNSAKAAAAAARAAKSATTVKQARAHAAEAEKAADAAGADVTKAKKVHDTAVRTDAGKLATRMNEALTRARGLAAQEDKRDADQRAADQAAKDLRAEADKLAGEAASGADPAKIAPEGRAAALATAKTARPHSRSAALTALAGSDTDIAAYLSTGRADADAQDDRADVEHLAETSDYPDVRTEAAKALQGDNAAVTAFLTMSQFEVIKQQMRVRVAQFLTGAGPIEEEAIRRAEDADTVVALHEFLTTGEAFARIQDDRVHTAQLLDSPGAELRAAARVALDGPTDLLHTFITTGQFTARSKDRLAATHATQIKQLIAHTAGVAATARKSAAEAAKARPKPAVKRG